MQQHVLSILILKFSSIAFFTIQRWKKAISQNAERLSQANENLNFKFSTATTTEKKQLPNKLIAKASQFTWWWVWVLLSSSSSSSSSCNHLPIIRTNTSCALVQFADAKRAFNTKGQTIISYRNKRNGSWISLMYNVCASRS